MAAGGLAAQTSVMARPGRVRGDPTFAFASSETRGEDVRVRTWADRAFGVRGGGVPAERPATGVVSPAVLLLKDTRAGQAGNTVSLPANRPAGRHRVVKVGTARGRGAARRRGGGAHGDVREGVRGVGSGGLVPRRLERTDETGCSTTRGVLEERLGGRASWWRRVGSPPASCTLTAEEDEGGFENEMAEELGRARSFQYPRTPRRRPRRRRRRRRGGSTAHRIIRCRAFRRVRLEHKETSVFSWHLHLIRLFTLYRSAQFRNC